VGEHVPGGRAKERGKKKDIKKSAYKEFKQGHREEPFQSGEGGGGNGLKWE